MDQNKNKDFTDYFMLFLNSGRVDEFPAAFDKLVKEAKLYEEHVDEDLLKKEYEDYKNVEFYDAIKTKYINRPISFSAIVRGEAQKPYIYPVKVRVTCDMTRGDMCGGCGLFLTGGKLDLDLSNINPLELIDINNESKIRFVKKKLGIMQCGQFKLELLEQKYMQELFLSPDVKYNDEVKEQRFIIRHAYSEGSEVIPNKTYKFYGIPTSLPKNQSLVYYMKRHEEEESDLDIFKLSEQDKKDLKIFQSHDIEGKLKEIYEDLSVNISPSIRFRDDIMFACDLSFHSVLHFWFGNSFEKGWVECLIVGDTSVGKTKIASKLIRHYQAGIIQGAENSTIAGLIGGMTKFESINIMTWGLLPLNNARMVILDEMSGIDKKVFGELTRIRSEGIAERTIVGGSSSTPAKVRLVWLSNPRKRSMKLYDSGCDMVKELVGSEEDISRFDFILTVAGDEIKTEKINALGSTGINFLTKHKYKSDLCNKLILWAWSRKASDIIIDKDVEKLILEYSIDMSKKYTAHFPLVLGSTIRLKLARLSIALAIRLFSTEDGENVIVKEEHVDYIYFWLNKIYNKPSFGYAEYSSFFNQGEEKEESSKIDILKTLNLYCHNLKNFIVNMLTNPRITALEVRDFAGCDKDQADIIRTNLVEAGFLIKKAGFYVKSDIFRKFLKEELKKL